MRCPYCSDTKSHVTDSRDSGAGIRRRRECGRCGVRFTTYERIQSAALIVAKRDARREEFNRDKLLSSIRLACAKRPLPTGTLEKVVDDIEASLQRLGRAEVPVSMIGEMVIDRLQELDRVAYIRYASVYRDFDDLEEFSREIEALYAAMRESQRQGATSQLSLLPEDAAVRQAHRPRRGRRPRVTLQGKVVELRQHRQAEES
jgi:transcriptional repressor NrdR